VDEYGAPPRETSVHRLVYDANGKLLYDNTWRSYYVGEPSLVRVGTKAPAKKKAEKKPAAGASGGTAAATTGSDGAGASGPSGTATTPAATTPTVTTPARQ
jgi:hypothetical protein